LQPAEIYVDDEAKLTLHGLVQHYVMLHEEEKNRKLTDLLDALDFNQVRLDGCVLLPSSILRFSAFCVRADYPDMVVLGVVAVYCCACERRVYVVSAVLSWSPGLLTDLLLLFLHWFVCLLHAGGHLCEERAARQDAQRAAERVQLPERVHLCGHAPGEAPGGVQAVQGEPGA
jgi:hypothetical protein